ncbi:ABC1-domain-containing protein [Martensiomyces pterosporus]|nr:ABC1-domain-containing protein [Martensiomyces pterosporus]
MPQTRRWKRAAVATSVSLGIGGYIVYNHDTAYLVAASLYRSSVAARATCQVAWDYYRNFPELPPEGDHSVSADERQRILDARSMVHLRSAERVRQALMKNGGVYIKLGQHVSAMQDVLPMEWCSTMQPLQDQNTASPIEDVDRVIRDDVGKSIDELFSSFDTEPIGVASLAQVHRAVMKETGEVVAVKVQHPKVRQYSDIDIATVSVMFEFIHSVFPDFKFMWLSSEMRGSLPRELDFRSDKSNAEQVLWNFSSHPDIPLAVPKMIRASERVLIMEYIDGKRCDDLQYLRQHGISPDEVSREIGRVFAEMTFVQGFLHCDPHPGNLFVRPRNRNETTHGHNFDLVLLDHGLYRQLPAQFRYEYAEMWHALMRGDKEQIKYWSKQLSGTDLYELFSIILTGQSWNTIEAKSLSKTTTQGHFSLDLMMQQRPNLIQQISEVLSSVPPVLLLVLKTNDLLRMIDHKLHYCLVAIRDARAADIHHSGARHGLVATTSRVGRLIVNWLNFWLLDSALSLYKMMLSVQDVLIRWRQVLWLSAAA